MPPTRLTLTPPPADRSAFRLTESEEQSLIDLVVSVRQTLRRATRESYGTDAVLSAYSMSLADWPAARRAPVLRAVAALVRLPAPRPAMMPAARLTDDAIDLGGGAA
jgi:hypothetical protein